MDSLAGKLLVAAADLVDPNFATSVVLVIHHDQQGAFGIVLNRVGTARLADIWKDVVHQPCAIDLPMGLGGPLDGPLMALHGNPKLAEREVVPGVYFSSHKDLLTGLVAEARHPLRVFSGYSGWGPGQLEAEIETGSWTVADATHGIVFSDEATMWRHAVNHSAASFLIRSLRIKHVPAEPWHN